jgi:hypothetical protein
MRCSLDPGLIIDSFDERMKYSAVDLCFSEEKHTKGCDSVRQGLLLFSSRLKKKCPSLLHNFPVLQQKTMDEKNPVTLISLLYEKPLATS